MGKIVLLVSREEMLHQAHNILQEKKFEIGEMRVIETKDTVIEARKAIAGGATLIIARGLQASMIKQYTDIPVAEIVMTAQEMALLVMKAKQILKKEHPVIAVVGFKNMFCDMSFFDMIYDIELRTYFASAGEELEQTARKAAKEQADLIIGGDTAVSVATEYGIPSLFLSPTEDSMRNAMAIAERMDYAMGVEKRKEAQFEALLDNSLNGVMRTDSEGKITAMNPIMEELLGEKEAAYRGRSLFRVFRDIDPEMFRNLVENKRDNDSLFLQVRRSSVLAVLAPIVIEGKVDGIILTCSPVQRRPRPDTGRSDKERSERARHKGLVALGQFEDILQKSQQMQICVKRARLFALSERAVLLTGEPGTELSLMAQAIHNQSLRSQGPYAAVSCVGQTGEQQENLIFGQSGILPFVDGGTLFIESIESLTPDNQYKLAKLIRSKRYLRKGDFQKRTLDVRIIAASGRDLGRETASGAFLAELYYLLQGLVIRIPPLRERKEDLREKIRQCIRKSCETCARHHVLTEGAYKVLLDYPWNGNLIQVEAFCECLILTAEKRSLDEISVKETLRSLYSGPASDPGPGTKRMGETPSASGERAMDARERKIRALLQEYGGKRQEVARAMGISKSTLWRYMKKYEIGGADGGSTGMK